MIAHQRLLLQMAAISHIKVRKKTTYSKIAESIHVSAAHLCRVASGERFLADDKFDLLCEVWGVNVKGLVNSLNKSDKDEFRRKSVVRLLNSKKYHINKINELTGIPSINLFDIASEVREATDEEMQTICEALKLDLEEIEEGRIQACIDFIDKTLDYMYFNADAKSALMHFLNQNA